MSVPTAYGSVFLIEGLIFVAAAAIAMKKGGLAKLEIATELRYARCATLAWLLTSKQLALLA